jgi:sugar phosphate isomerase/epimerase
MVFGLSSFTYGWAVGAKGPGNFRPDNYRDEKPMTEMDLLHKTLKAGMTCLQVGDNLPLHLLSTERLEQFRSSVNQKNIRLEVGARGLDREHLNRYIDIASIFNSPLLRFVVDGDQYEPDSAEIITIIKESIPRLKENNLVLGIENHDRFKAKELSFIMQSVDSDHVGICLDCVNSMGAGEGLEWVASILIPFTVNLHVKDFVIQRVGHQMGFTVTGTPLGKGMIQLPALLEKLYKYNRCESAVIEQWVTPEATLAETIRKEEKWAEESIEYIKKLSSFNPSDLS